MKRGAFADEVLLSVESAVRAAMTPPPVKARIEAVTAHEATSTDDAAAAEEAMAAETDARSAAKAKA